MTETDNSVIVVFSWITLGLMIGSIVGAFLTIVTFAIHGTIRTYPITLIMYLCVCIVIGFEAFLMAFEPWIYDTSGVCIVVAICVHYFFLANFLWTFCVAFNFYQMIVRRNREAPSLEKYYHLFSWGIPAIYCAFTGGFAEYGDLGGVCYIKSPTVRFVCFFIPGLVIISSNAVLFFFIAREIHETLSGAPKSDKRDRMKEFRVYLSIFISIGLSWIFGYLMFLLPFPIVSDIFFILFSIFTPLQGLLIFIFYATNPKVLAAWLHICGRCIPFCDRVANMLTNTQTSSRSGPSRSGPSRSSSSSSSASMSSSNAL